MANFFRKLRHESRETPCPLEEIRRMMHPMVGGADVSRVWLSGYGLIDLFAKDVAVSCMPGKFFDHGEQGPSHADCPFTGVVLGVVEVEAGGDHTGSLACTLELGDHVGHGLFVCDGEGALVSVRVSIAFGFVESRPESLEPDPFSARSML